MKGVPNKLDKVFDNSALSIQPITNGFIIAYRKEDEEQNGKMTVAYKMFSFESGQVNNVTRNVYLLSKFGPAYKQIEAKLPTPFYWKTVALPNEKLLAFYPDGKAALFDAEAKMGWNGIFKFEGEGVSDISFSGKHFWCVYEGAKCVMRLNPLNMKQEIRIGGKTSNFGAPISLFTDCEHTYVCDKEKCMIWRIDQNTYNVEEYLHFDEPVLQFLKIDGFSLVQLESGIYKL